MLEERAWPSLSLFSGASVLGVAKSIQEPQKWHFTGRNEGGLMGGGRDWSVCEATLISYILPTDGSSCLYISCEIGNENR